jgi:hypothetical protein
MASPLKWFRKNEKILLGVFGVLIMFVFTLSIGSGIDPIIDWLSGGGVQTKSSIAGPLVAKWKGGSLNESDMFNLKQNRNLVIQYLYAIEQQASMRGSAPQTQPLPRLNSEESLLEMALLEREANKQGIVITDEAVLNYLVMLSGGSMQPAEFLQLWQTITQNRGTERQLFALLRSELSAARLRGLVWSGTRAASPIAFWDFYNRTEKRVDAELMAIEVADFIDEVPEPSERELTAFYDLYAAKHSIPGSPTPGFRQRRRLAFESIRFDYQEFIDAEKELVTDEEIKTYYEENKSEFVKGLPEDDLQAPDAAAEEAVEETDANEAAGPAESDSASDADEASEESTTAEEPAPSPSPVPQDVVEEAAAPVAEQTEAVIQAATQPVTETEEVATTEAPAEAAAADDATETTKPSETEATADTSASADEYKPLSEVEDDIRRAIAAPRAQEKVETAIKAARARMNKYYKQYVMYEVQKQKDETLEPPTMPTFDDISETPPVSVSSIPLSDRYEVGQFELGQAVEFQFLQDRILRIPFGDIVYEEKTIPEYQPRQFPSAEVSPQFVYWCVGQEEAKTPELDEIRDAVVDAWKMQKAADLALAAATEQATKANQAGKKLAECLDYPNATTFQSGEISWLTGGNVPLGGSNQPRYSEIPGVDAPSEEMFSRLFRLQPGEVGAAMNRPRTTAYVMRSAEPTTPAIDRAQQFMNAGLNSPTLYPVLRNESQTLLSGWFEELKEEYDLTWLREPQGNSRM